MEDKKTIVLALSTMQRSSEAIDFALDYADKEHAKLVVLFVVDARVPNLVFEELTDSGFIGEKPSGELKTAIENEHRKQAKEKSDEVRKLADVRGLDYDLYLEEGDFFELSLQAIYRSAADLIILTRPRRSPLTRLFSSSAVDQLSRRAPCEVKIFEEAQVKS